MLAFDLCLLPDRLPPHHTQDFIAATYRLAAIVVVAASRALPSHCVVN